MSKTLKTKRKILALLKGKDMTITGLSAALGLSNATVSQHIEELSRAGTIERVENEHFRKLKYYRIRETESPPIANYAKYLIATVIVLAVALEFYFYSLTPIPHQPANGAMAVRAGVNNSTYGQYAPGVIASEAVPGSFPASVANVLNASGADGFNFTQQMFVSNSSSGCVLARISACDNNAPSQFACLNSGYYQAYLGQRQAAFSKQPQVCPQYLLAGTLSCVSSGGYCEVNLSNYVNPGGPCMDTNGQLCGAGTPSEAWTFWGQTGPFGLPLWEWAAILAALAIIAVVWAYLSLRAKGRAGR